jgi:hypothetical protein
MARQAELKGTSIMPQSGKWCKERTKHTAGVGTTVNTDKAEVKQAAIQLSMGVRKGHGV